jgi:hypothetical protein
VQHITTPDKSFLVGDVATDLLMRYAALIAQLRGGDSVKVNAISGDGDDVVATLLLNSGTLITAETTRSSQQEPENSELEQYLRGRLEEFTDTPGGYPGVEAEAAER